MGGEDFQIDLAAIRRAAQRGAQAFAVRAGEEAQEVLAGTLNGAFQAEDAGQAVRHENGVGIRVPVPDAAARTLDGDPEALFIVFQLLARGFQAAHLHEDQGGQAGRHEDRGDEHQPVEGNGAVPGVLVDAHGAERIDAQIRAGNRCHSEGDALLAEPGIGGRAAATVGQAFDKTGIEAEAFGQRGAGAGGPHLRTNGQHAAILVGQGDHAIVAPIGQDGVGAEPGHEGADRAVGQLGRNGQDEMGALAIDNLGGQAGGRVQRRAGGFAQTGGHFDRRDGAAIGQEQGDVFDNVGFPDRAQTGAGGGDDLVERRVAQIGAGEGEGVARLGHAGGDAFGEIAGRIGLGALGLGDQGFALLLDLHQENAAIGEREEEHGQHDPDRTGAALGIRNVRLGFADMRFRSPHGGTRRRVRGPACIEPHLIHLIKLGCVGRPCRLPINLPFRCRTHSPRRHPLSCLFAGSCGVPAPYRWPCPGRPAGGPVRNRICCE